MTQLLKQVLESYFTAHKELIEAESEGENDVVVSFPFHYVGNHRVEISVTKVMGGQFVLSDMGQTIGELKEYGYALAAPLLARMVEIAKPAQVRIVDQSLIANCDPERIGAVLHEFAEAAKTIGDAYLAYKVKTPPDLRLIDEIRRIFETREIAYKFAQKVRGKIDVHPIDFVIPPNGHPGLALSAIGGANTHNTAQIWFFKCQDIRAQNLRMKVGLVYDVEQTTWSSKSETILREQADFAIPSDQIKSLGDTVTSAIT